MVRSWALLGLLALAPALFAADPVPTDLPNNTVGLMHLRVDAMAQAPDLALVREIFRKAGPKAIATLDRFAFSPADIASVTAVVTLGEEDRPPGQATIIRLKKATSADKLRAMLVPNGQKELIGGATYYSDATTNLTLRVLSDTSFAIGAVGMVERAYEVKAGAPVQFARLKEWMDNHLIIAGDASKIPAEALAEVPDEFKAALEAKAVYFGLQFATDSKVRMHVDYGSADKAIAAEKAMKAAASLGREKLKEASQMAEQQVLKPEGDPTIQNMPLEFTMLYNLASLNQYDKLLSNPPVKRVGTSLTMETVIPAKSVQMASVVVVCITAITTLGQNANAQFKPVGGPVAVRGQLPRDFAETAALKQQALAMHNYHDAYNKFPAHAIYSKDGKKPLLSWRVALLPYLEQDLLYKQFKLDEPWDSDHNKALIEKMPKIYHHSAQKGDPKGKTHFCLFTGKGTAFELANEGPRFPKITDGTSNTLMITEAREPVIWTKPDDLVYDAKKPLPKLGANSEAKYFFIATFDGAVHKIKADFPEDELRKFITPNGGEVSDLNKLQAK